MWENYPIDLLRVSKETRPQLKTFINLDENKLGIAIDLEKEEAYFFIYKDKRKNQILKSKTFSFWIHIDDMQSIVFELISEYYESAGRSKELPIYTKMELCMITSHFHYHALAGSLAKVLEPEVIYN